MGCFVSKLKATIANKEQHRPLSSYVSPLSRTVSISTPLVHHPPLRKGDSHHLVSLTSTTYGSLLLIDSNRTDPKFCQDMWCLPLTRESTDMSTLSMKLENDSRKSHSPVSVINTWELMDGLNDCLLDDDGKKQDRPGQTDPITTPETTETHGSVSPAMEEKEVTVAYFADTEYLTTNSRKRSSDDVDDSILLYFTSLRGVRKTHEDCCMVRMIFRGYSVHVNERDISMDFSYKKDLQNKLKGNKLSLPRVFIQGEHVGGAVEIKQLHESGELTKLLVGFLADDSFGASCGSCGEVRFLPCPCCSGSRKVFDKESERFRRCMDCNENGLIQCPGCCSS